MSEPIRYDPGCEPDTLDTEAVMFQCPNGGFVKWVDYARLKAEVERLTDELDQAECDYDNCQKRKVSIDNHRFDLFTENKTLKAENERLTERLNRHLEINDELDARCTRLRKAGDMVIDIIWDDDDGTIDTWNKAVNLWNAAKEGKQP